MVKEFVITNEQGIHARPATNLVQKANQFKSEIMLTYNGDTVDLKSIMGVLSLGVTRGSQITVRVEGVDELEAMQQITKMINEMNS